MWELKLSLIIGLQQYPMKQGNGYLQDLMFLVKGAFSPTRMDKLSRNYYTAIRFFSHLILWKVSERMAIFKFKVQLQKNPHYIADSM